MARRMNGLHEDVDVLKSEIVRLDKINAELLAALQIARQCIAYCRRAHKDAQSGDGFPVEIIIDAALKKAGG